MNSITRSITLAVPAAASVFVLGAGAAHADDETAPDADGFGIEGVGGSGASRADLAELFDADPDAVGLNGVKDDDGISWVPEMNAEDFAQYLGDQGEDAPSWVYELDAEDIAQLMTEHDENPDAPLELDSDVVYCIVNPQACDTTGEPEGDPENEPEGNPEGEPEGDPEGDPESEPEGDPEGDPEEQPEGDPEDEPQDGDPKDEPQETDSDDVPLPTRIDTGSGSGPDGLQLAWLLAGGATVTAAGTAFATRAASRRS